MEVRRLGAVLSRSVVLTGTGRSRLRLGFANDGVVQPAAGRGVRRDGEERSTSVLRWTCRRSGGTQGRRRQRGRYEVRVEDDAVEILYARSTRVVFRATHVARRHHAKGNPLPRARALVHDSALARTRSPSSALLVFQCKIAPCFPRGHLL